MRNDLDPEAGQEEAREVLRRPVQLRARLRGGTMKFDISVLDLSPTGFRGETGCLLPEGSVVWITLPGLSSLEAIVIWQRRDQFGCRFRRPLHVAVLDHLVALGR